MRNLMLKMMPTNNIINTILIITNSLLKVLYYFQFIFPNFFNDKI